VNTSQTNNSTYLKLSGGQLTGNLGFGVAPSSTILINCYNASSTAFQNIQMMNNIGEFFQDVVKEFLICRKVTEIILTIKVLDIKFLLSYLYKY
jgi:hypothetical protein